MKLTVDLGPNSYPIHIENGILAKHATIGTACKNRRTCKRSVLREKNHDRFR